MFYYHMLGRDVGKLNVYVDGKKKFTRTGPQGNAWKKADIKVQERAQIVSESAVKCYIIQIHDCINDIYIHFVRLRHLYKHSVYKNVVFSAPG